MEKQFTKREFSPLRKEFEELNEVHSLLSQLERVPESQFKNALVGKLNAKLNSDSPDNPERVNSVLRDENSKLQKRIQTLTERLDELLSDQSEAGPPRTSQKRSYWWLWLLIAAGLIALLLRSCHPTPVVEKATGPYQYPKGGSVFRL